MSMLALPLAAAVLLKATPTQMGLLSALEVLPFALFSLPTGVYLDRWRKLPVYVAGESALALAMASVTLHGQRLGGELLVVEALPVEIGRAHV